MTSERIAGLRQRVIDGCHRQYWREGKPREESRALSSDLPVMLRKAYALDECLRRTAVYIDKNELIAGGPTVFALDGFTEDAQPQSETPEIEPYYNPYGQENVCVGHRNVLKHGLAGLRVQAEHRLAAIRAEDEADSRQDFLKAVIIVCEAAGAFARRHAVEAQRLASIESEDWRRDELIRIAAVCERVSEHPPRSFHEALQAVWFTHLVVRIEGGELIGVGRLDQLLFPYLQHDLAQGSICREDAQELLEAFFIKFNVTGDRPGQFEAIRGDNGQTIMLGGQTADGLDATNELSYMCLDAAKQLRLIDPKIVVRWHRGTPVHFRRASCELARLGMGFPIFCNDEVIIPALQAVEYVKEDARDYTVAGCWECIIPARSDDRTNMHEINVLRCVELACNDGKRLLGAKQEGPRTGTLSDYSSFGEFIAAVKKQLTCRIEACVGTEEWTKPPAAFLSATMDGCIDKGLDISQGGCPYNNTGLWISALANAADAVAAIKLLVYEERRLPAKSVLSALRADYEGDEELRGSLLNCAPKFGNDDPYVDDLAAELAYHCEEEFSRHRNQRGGRYKPGIASALAYIHTARVLGASADGRHAREPFGVDASPAPGRDRLGPTAAIRSYTHVDLTRFPNTTILELKLHPNSVAGDEGLEKLTALVLGFMELGGGQLMLNVVSAETLRRAQKHPDEYRGLIVRVWGFSAYFVDLPVEFQEHIISRTTHTL